MRNLHVTIWQVNTNAMQYLDLHTRLAYLYKTVDQAYAHLRDQPITKHRVRGIFVVPENYFAAQSHGGRHQLSENRYLTSDEAHDIQTSLECLSQIYPGLLIIPGTITWKKPICDPEKIGPAPFEATADIYHLYASYDETDRQLLRKTLGELFDAETQQALLHGCDTIKPLDTFGFRSVHAYLNGKQVYHADKYDEIDNNLAPATLPSHSPVFELDGLRFGIETFLDHAYGALNTSVDVHIILSNCARRTHGNGKYVIYATHNANLSGAWKAKKGKYYKLNCHVENDIMDYEMQTA